MNQQLSEHVDVELSDGSQLSEHVDVELSDGSQCGETETPYMLYVTNHKLIRKHAYIRDYFTN